MQTGLGAAYKCRIINCTWACNLTGHRKKSDVLSLHGAVLAAAKVEVLHLEGLYTESVCGIGAALQNARLSLSPYRLMDVM